MLYNETINEGNDGHNVGNVLRREKIVLLDGGNIVVGGVKLYLRRHSTKHNVK